MARVGVDVSYYELLGVAPDATTTEIRRAYWRQAMHAHPDQGGSAEQFRAVHAAYLVLTDPLSRAEHDAALAESETVQAPPQIDESYAYVDIAVVRVRRASAGR